MTNLVLTRPRGGGSGSGTVPGGLQLSIINGQPTMTFLDSTRLVGSPPVSKRLSVAEHVVVYNEAALSVNDWVRMGNASDTDTGFISNFDGTIVFASAHCEDTAANSKDIHLFVNAVDQGSIGTLTGGANAIFVNTTIDIDVVQGDRIRLQAQGAGGNIQDTVISLTLKWRSI